MTSHRISRSKTLHEGKRNLLELTIQGPDGHGMMREVLDSPAAAAVLPYDRDRRKAILVRQFRAPVLYAGGSSDLLEAIAGLLDGDEAPEACIRREAMEEAGLHLDTLEPVGAAWSTPGFSTERVHLFLAPYGPAARRGEGGGLPEEQEHIEVHELAIEDLARMLEQKALADLKTMALVQALWIRHPDLFRRP